MVAAIKPRSHVIARALNLAKIRREMKDILQVKVFLPMAMRVKPRMRAQVEDAHLGAIQIADQVEAEASSRYSDLVFS